ncbi:MAG TPA: GNAT family N-acetyltransferase [Candidatus Baltobacteraceae bacterium]|nr:GNAT family N-acetyltransferase [Candidatus Baltobacteraceae bacterium]
MSLNPGRSRSTIFVAVDSDKSIVGFAQLFSTSSTVWLGLALILEDLYVKPEARRKGIATKLLDAAVRYAREIGAVSMFLETAMDNLAAQAAYEATGWTREDRFCKYNAAL